MLKLVSAAPAHFTLLLIKSFADLEGIMLSEIRQTEKDKHHMISLICGR